MKNPNYRIFTAKNIGSVASEILSKDQEAHISGKTSKGVFIKTSGKWLIFLSFEKFKGPLTITLDKIDPILRLVSGGASIRINSQSIFIPDLDLTIKTAGSEVWQPSLPSALPIGDSERSGKLVDFAQEIMAKKDGVGLGSLIPSLLGFSHAQLPLKIINNLDLASIRQIQDYLRDRQAIPLARLLSTLLGSGPGLTPSADDFILGLLLALNRWQSQFWKVDRLRELNFRVLEAAYARTTTLSANLIECATLNLADERLINALDWIVTGVAPEPEVISHLLGWGNSSGVDSFTGMAVTLTA
jgi:hypothetical protein